MSTKAIVSIYKVGDSLLLSPSQRHTDKTFVSAIAFHRVEASASDLELGHVAIQALDESSALSAVPDVSPQQRDKEWEAALAVELHLPDYKAVYKAALLTSLYWYDDGDVEVAPSIHESGHFLTKVKEMTTLSFPSAEALGAAIKATMERSE